jgi:hypothetical protein
MGITAPRAMAKPPILGTGRVWILRGFGKSTSWKRSAIFVIIGMRLMVMKTERRIVER